MVLGVHLSGVVSLIATVPAVAAFALRKSLPLPASIALWHIAGCGFAVAVAATEAFAQKTTSMLGKNANGTFSPLKFTLFWPYHVGLRAKLAIQRRVSTEPAWNQVSDTYFIGAWPSEEALVPAIHPAIIDVTCELPLQISPPAYKLLPTWDTHGPTPKQIDEGVDFALEQAAMGRAVLCHCAHGHGRSATILAAILIADGTAQSIEQAEALMKQHRPRVRLNKRQRASLKQWMGQRKKQ